MFWKFLKHSLLLCAVLLGSSAEFGHLAAQTPPAETPVEMSQDPPATEQPIEIPAEIPEPTATPSDVVVDTPTPSPTIALTEPAPEPPRDVPIDATPALEPSSTPVVADPEARIVDIDFSSIDPASSPALSTGIITIAYANAPLATDWHLVLTFGDFSGVGNGDAISAAELSLLGITGAETAQATFDEGVLTLSFSADLDPPPRGTLVVTVQLAISEPFGATVYRSKLEVSIAPEPLT